MRAPPFRPIDLLVSLAIGVALLLAVAGARRAAEDDSVIAGCADKMRQLSQSLVMYQGLYDGHFPRTRYDPAAPLTAYTNPDAPDPFAAAGPAANDVTAAMFLLARVMDLPPEAFTCPAAIRNGLAEEDDFDRRTARQRSNFRNRVHDNYALANMYPDAAAVGAGYSLDRFAGRLPATFVIAGDTSPGGDGVRTATTRMARLDMRQGNSPNHERDGQNLMFADGSVRFYNAPFVGVDHDNVYTGRDVAGSRQPGDANDTILLPAWPDGPQTLARATANRRWALGLAAIGTLGVIAWVVRHGMKRATGISPPPPGGGGWGEG